MKYVFDIDGTVCTNTNGMYDLAKPVQERIDIINRLYDDGHTIWFQTARGMGRTNNDVSAAHDMYYDYTLAQLKSWGLKFHGLMMGKVSGDWYIDDRCVTDVSFFDEDCGC